MENFAIFSEVDDLMRSHAFLTDLVERQSIPVFEDMDTALRCTAKVVQKVSAFAQCSAVRVLLLLESTSLLLLQA